MARITLWGFYQYDRTLFDGVVLPAGIDKDNLVSNIMRNSGDLYPYHQVPEYLKKNITFWFSRRLFDFERMYEALRVEYSPIENYDRKENTTRNYENSGTDKESTTLGSTTTSTNIGSNDNENKVSAYNESDYTNREKDTQSYNSTLTNTGSGTDTQKQTHDSTITNTGSGSDEKKQTYDSTVTNTGSGSDRTQTDYGKQRTEKENTRIHGNIGVTTSQQMIESEMSLRAKYDIYKIIAREFEREFLVQIY